VAGRGTGRNQAYFYPELFPPDVVHWGNPMDATSTKTNVSDMKYIIRRLSYEGGQI